MALSAYAELRVRKVFGDGDDQLWEKVGGRRPAGHVSRMATAGRQRRMRALESQVLTCGAEERDGVGIGQVLNHGPQPARENDRERFELLGIIDTI